MEPLLDDRRTSNRPHPPRRQSGARRSRPSLSFRLATGIGFAAVLLGLGIAVSVGAVQMPLSGSSTKALRAATLASAPASRQAGVSAYGSALAVPPSQVALYPEASVSLSPTRSATAKHTPRPTVTPTAAASSAQPTSSSPSASSSLLTPTATAEYQTPTGRNELAWSEAILTALGAPLTNANIISMGYWMQNEAGTPPYGIVGANNPINVSEPGYGGTQIQYEAPGYYLMSYPTVQDGVAAIAAYLNNGSYPGILSDLKAGTGLNDPNLASELQEYSGSGYSTIPDSWGASQGTPETP